MRIGCPSYATTASSPVQEVGRSALQVSGSVRSHCGTISPEAPVDPFVQQESFEAWNDSNPSRTYTQGVHFARC
jgi:hypothetical protein